LNTAGAARYPATQASRTAVFSDAGVSVDANNYVNTFTSYYVYGGAIALALDLRLRSEFKLTLDDYMRAVWLAHGKKEKPYVVKDLQNVLASITNPKFAADFFGKYVNGIEKNNYTDLLAKAGYIVRTAQPGKAWAGITAAQQRGRSGQAGTVGSGFAIVNNTAIGTPVYKAGIDAGDVILSVDGSPVNDAATFNQAISAKKPGDKVKVTYRNRSGQHTTDLELAESPILEVVTFEKAGRTPSAEQLTFRNDWLSSKAK
jgi:predicted metalloprotease with PDZ domain